MDVQIFKLNIRVACPSILRNYAHPDLGSYSLCEKKSAVNTKTLNNVWKLQNTSASGRDFSPCHSGVFVNIDLCARILITSPRSYHFDVYTKSRALVVPNFGIQSTTDAFKSHVVTVSPIRETR